MTNGLALVLPNDRTGVSGTRHEPQNRMRRRPLGAQSHGIGMAVVAKRCRIACRAILSHAKPRRRNPYGESQLTGNSIVMHRYTVAVLLGAGLLYVMSWLGLTGRIPDLIHPFPLILIVPYMLGLMAKVAWIIWLVPMIGPTAFLLWSSHLFRGSQIIPRRSIVLLVALIVLSVIYFISLWSWGITYQGVIFTVFMAAANFCMACSLVYLGFYSKKSPTFIRNYIFHLSIFVWLVWSAFPYMGELP